MSRFLPQAMNPNSLFLDSATRKRNASIISAHPPVLSYSVPQRLQPFVEYLQELGIQDVGAAISNRPSLLGLDANQQIR
ncbi:uncharacterized protein HaLaN_11040 [Haematococcus lacustris]|uniref:Uncharacterized protein n=1 Tax=Haematococcus lacustris TaxID=44745 RepID=A0A699YXC2_HAELA|nr:uncharacterized protein HaLaN_11040 [Haematococcus lacustris]